MPNSRHLDHEREEEGEHESGIRKYKRHKGTQRLRLSNRHQLRWGHLKLTNEEILALDEIDEEAMLDEDEDEYLRPKKDTKMYVICDCEFAFIMRRSKFMKLGGRRVVRDCNREDCEWVAERKRLAAKKIEDRKMKRRTGGAKGRPVLYGAKALNKSVRMSGEMNDRIQVVAEEMGKAWNRAAVLLLESALKRVED